LVQLLRRASRPHVALLGRIPGTDRFSDRVRAEATRPELVVLDLSAAPYVDLQAAHTLAGMAADLSASGIRVQAVEARSAVRDRLRAEGLEDRLGGINRFTSVADAVDSFHPPGGTASGGPQDGREPVPPIPRTGDIPLADG
jgi:MFS superfamily sulfate permease-like transporter